MSSRNSRPIFPQFLLNRELFGSCSSWAVWKAGAAETSRFQPDAKSAPALFLNNAVKDLNNVGDFAAYEGLPWMLRKDIVLIALNFAERPVEIKAATATLNFHAFHEENSLTSDLRLRDACMGTPLWGSYMTDLVKFSEEGLEPLRDSNAKKVETLLKDQQFLERQIDGLAKELKQLGCVNPTLVAMGSTVHNALKSKQALDKLRSSLGAETQLLKITHYSKAAGIRHHDYVALVYSELRQQGLVCSQ